MKYGEPGGRLPMDSIYIGILMVMFASVLTVAVAGITAERKYKSFRGW
jgi:hypothetical protein